MPVLVKQLTTHNNALTIGQQRLPTAEGMFRHMEWSEGVACGVVDSCYLGLGAIVNLQNVRSDFALISRAQILTR